MPKSRTLTRNSVKHSSDALATDPQPQQQLTRPRTAGGEKNILRKFRFGRFFGLGSNYSTINVPIERPGAKSSSTSLRDKSLFRTSTLHTESTGNDLLADIPEPPPPLPLKSSSLGTKLLSKYSSKNSLDNKATLPSGYQPAAASFSTQGKKYDPHNIRYSIMSRRSSAPDVSDFACRASRISSSSTEMHNTTSSSDSLESSYQNAGDSDPSCKHTSPLVGHISNNPDRDKSDNNNNAYESDSGRSSDNEYLADLLNPKASNSTSADSTKCTYDNEAVDIGTSIPDTGLGEEYPMQNSELIGSNEAIYSSTPRSSRVVSQLISQDTMLLSTDKYSRYSTCDDSEVFKRSSDLANLKGHCNLYTSGLHDSNYLETYNLDEDAGAVLEDNANSIYSDRFSSNGSRNKSDSDSSKSSSNIDRGVNGNNANINGSFTFELGSELEHNEDVADRFSNEGYTDECSGDDINSGDSGSTDPDTDTSFNSSPYSTHNYNSVISKNTDRDLDCRVGTTSDKIRSKDDDYERKDSGVLILHNGNGGSRPENIKKLVDPDMSKSSTSLSLSSSFSSSTSAQVASFVSSPLSSPRSIPTMDLHMTSFSPVNARTAFGATVPQTFNPSTKILMGSTKPRGDRSPRPSLEKRPHCSAIGANIFNKNSPELWRHQRNQETEYQPDEKIPEVHLDERAGRMHCNDTDKYPATNEMPLLRAMSNGYDEAEGEKGGEKGNSSVGDNSINSDNKDNKATNRKALTSSPSQDNNSSHIVVSKSKAAEKKGRAQSCPIRPKTRSFYEQHASTRSPTNELQAYSPKVKSPVQVPSKVMISYVPIRVGSFSEAEGRGGRSLSIDTHKGDRPFSLSPSNSPNGAVPSSAPVSELVHPFIDGHIKETKSTEANSGTIASSPLNMTRDGERSASSDKSDATSVAGSGRSLRVRSKLATSGLRRASTYVWERSSMFVRGVSSTDEITEYPQSPNTWGMNGDISNSSEKAESACANQGGSEGTENTLGSGAESTDEGTSTSVPPISGLAKNSPAAMRLHAARELVITEKNFVDNLFVIKKVWMEPVFSSANSPKPIIPYQTARVIFFGITELHSHASQFYRELDFALGTFERSAAASSGNSDDGMRIGMLFRSNERHWNDFISYVRNYGTAVNCLNQLHEYKPYLRYHEQCMLQKRTNRQSLKDLLMLPIQRITRYTLLLKNILKHTPAVHGDHIELCRAVKNVTHFASIVNECRRKQEEMHRIIEIFQTISQCPPLPPEESRSYITEFFVRELISRHPTRLLLFTDVLIITQAPANTKVDSSGLVDSTVEWVYHGMAFLDQVEIQNADESTNTLITILSLNRGVSSLGSPQSVRASLSGSVKDSSKSIKQIEQNADSLNNDLSSASATISSETSLRDSRKKKKKGRMGILQSNSGEFASDTTTSLSNVNFPSPVPAPMRLDRALSKVARSSTPTSASSTEVSRSSTMQRPKTAGSGSHTNSTITPSEPMHMHFPHPLDLPGHPSSSHSSSDILMTKLTQLTLVMQHNDPGARKQFVRSLKDASAKYILHLTQDDSDSLVEPSFSEISHKDVTLSMHPL